MQLASSKGGVLVVTSVVHDQTFWQLWYRVQSCKDTERHMDKRTKTACRRCLIGPQVREEQHLLELDDLLACAGEDAYGCASCSKHHGCGRSGYAVQSYQDRRQELTVGSVSARLALLSRCLRASGNLRQLSGTLAVASG